MPSRHAAPWPSTHPGCPPPWAAPPVLAGVGHWLRPMLTHRLWGGTVFPECARAKRRHDPGTPRHVSAPKDKETPSPELSTSVQVREPAWIPHALVCRQHGLPFLQETKDDQDVSNSKTHSGLRPDPGSDLMLLVTSPSSP